MNKKTPADTGALANAALAKGDSIGWFDELYTAASGDASVIPWADEKPNRYLVEWLDKNNIHGDGKHAIVIGCGLGDDAEELARRGFEVTAFDISESAIEWAKHRFPDTKVKYLAQDLFTYPKEWHNAFDFIFEAYTIQALPRSRRSEVIKQISALLKPNGSLYIVCRALHDKISADAFPWALTKVELNQFKDCGLSEISFEEFWDYDEPTRKRFRVLYKKIDGKA